MKLLQLLCCTLYLALIYATDYDLDRHLQMIKDLGGKDLKAKHIAASYLGKHQSFDAVAALIKALEDKDCLPAVDQKDPGSECVRYAAYKSLKYITRWDLPFQWDAPEA